MQNDAALGHLAEALGSKPHCQWGYQALTDPRMADAGIGTMQYMH